MTTTPPEQDPRATYVAGLRHLADLIESDEDFPLPYEGRDSALAFFTSSRDECARVVRAMSGTVDKNYDDISSYGFRATGSLGGLSVIVYADREQVRRKVVKGTREVTREVKDPDALAAVPTVTVTETVEDVEWVCEPILGEPVST